MTAPRDAYAAFFTELRRLYFMRLDAMAEWRRSLANWPPAVRRSAVIARAQFRSERDWARELRTHHQRIVSARLPA